MGSMGRPAGGGEVVGRVDQAHVGERLGHVADEAGGGGVELLGQETDVVPEVEQPLEELAGVVVAALEREDVGEPE